MSKQLIVILLFNLVIGVLFLLFNNYLWTEASYVEMDAFYIIAHGLVDPAFWTTHFNYIFWLFWLSTVVNLLFIIQLQRSKETTKSSA
jgi:hypothetical protein